MGPPQIPNPCPRSPYKTRTHIAEAEGCAARLRVLLRMRPACAPYAALRFKLFKG